MSEDPLHHVVHIAHVKSPFAFLGKRVCEHVMDVDAPDTRSAPTHRGMGSSRCGPGARPVEFWNGRDGRGCVLHWFLFLLSILLQSVVLAGVEQASGVVSAWLFFWWGGTMNSKPNLEGTWDVAELLDSLCFCDAPGSSVGGLELASTPWCTVESLAAGMDICVEIPGLKPIPRPPSFSSAS